MATRRTTKRAATRPRGTVDAFSTALLLPGIHPWLKEYLAEENLVTTTDEADGALPEWESIPHPTTSIATLIADAADATLPHVAQQAVRPPAVRAAHAAEILPRPVRTPAPARPPEVLIRAPLLEHSEVPVPRIVLRTTPVARTPQPLAAPPAGARHSTAPTPFAIPMDAGTHGAAPSTHLLRIARPQQQRAPARIAPNLLAVLQSTATTTQRRVRTTVTAASVKTRERLAQRTTDAAPWPKIPSPYDELLIVNVVAGPLELCWRAFGWQWYHTARTLLAAPSAQSAEPRRVQRAVTVLPRTPRFANVVRQWRDATTSLLHLPTTRFAHVATFAAVLLAVLLPLKILGWGGRALPAMQGRVLGATATVLDAMRDGGSALAQSSFADAIVAFDRAHDAIKDLPNAVGPVPMRLLNAARHIPFVGSTILGRAAAAHRAGLALTDASSAATRGLALLASIDPRDASALPYFRAARAAFTTASARADAAQGDLDLAAPDLADTLRGARTTITNAEALLAITEALGGFDRNRRILFVFQNPAELRPTGGFIGSIALLDVRHGAITALEVPGGGSYDISGMTRTRVQPPEPLLLLSDTWQFHDANWFPDFPTSAAKLRWFYEHSNGPSVDAVVAINAPFLEQILAQTGPITVNGQTFSSADVLATITNTVESSAARATGAPKALLGELAPAVLSRLLTLATSDDASGNGATRIALVDLLLRALNERDLLLAFTEDDVQRFVASAGWDGAIQQVRGDALAVYHANIGGGKSDDVMRETIRHDAQLSADGRLIDTVTITRTHTGQTPPPGATPLAKLIAKQHVDYLRVYVPRGATLLRADGFELPPGDAFEDPAADALPDQHLLAAELNPRIDANAPVRITEEFGRTAFGGWVLTPLGEQRTVTLTYELPWHYARARAGFLGSTQPADPQPYSLYVQKQPGTRAAFTHTLTLDPVWNASWTAANLTASDEHAWRFMDELRTDLSTGAMIAPR
ncbi:MAG: DUF4012 domain-containing protein [bacterium]|nr:DUF4012 domain-containing protein [bacterium]